MKNSYSIILPVRNGGEYVKECINSILSQTYRDFDILVLDNNSSDGTVEWINTINDRRIKYSPPVKTFQLKKVGQELFRFLRTSLLH